MGRHRFHGDGTSTDWEDTKAWRKRQIAYDFAVFRERHPPSQARDYLADRYPQHLEVDISGKQPKLKPVEGSDDGEMPDFAGDLGLKEQVDSLDESTVEEKLVPADVTRMVLWLASDDSRMCTGQLWVVDAGRM